jgi:two-component system, OmpR family, phosphate regulon sensor histidine kinase PhoR
VIELRRVAAVILLFLGVGVGLHLLINPLRDTGQPPAAKAVTLACGVALAVLGIIGGYLMARVPKERINSVSAYMENMVRRGTVGLVLTEGDADALGRLGHAVNRYLTFVKDEVEQTHITAKERQIQVKVLEAERRHLESVIHAISDGVIVTGAFGDLLLANSAAENILGFRFEAAARKPIEDAVADKSFLALLKEMRETGLFTPHRTVEWVQTSTSAPSAVGTVEGQGGGDAARTWRVIFNTVTEGRKHDRISGIVAVLHDVTKEKEIAKMKSEFVSNVSHELKAPLASIKAYVEMLMDGEVRDEAQSHEFFQTIAAETDRLNRMVENILNLSRLESGLVPVNKSDLAVTEILRDVADVMTPQADKKNVRLEADLAPVFFRVRADRDMLYQSVLNVVSNAVKYTPEGGQVRISTYLADGAVVVEVADTGYGIPQSELGKIFEKFYRARLSSRAAAGTGLGLALVKHVIETVHGGQIDVKSEVGKGSVFRLLLPAVR